MNDTRGTTSTEGTLEAPSDARLWADEWRYWLGGALILSTIWAVQSIRADEWRFYWPLMPLAVWAAVLLAIAIWPAPRSSAKAHRRETSQPSGNS